MTGSVFVCRLIIPYGKGKAVFLSFCFLITQVSIPYGKGKVYRFLNTFHSDIIVSIPYGKGKVFGGLYGVSLSTVSIPYGKGKA